MADSFLADLWLALLRASDGDVERAASAFNWLRNEAPRGQGCEPGWRGRVFLPTDRTALKERQKQMLRLDEFGYKDEEIAAAVNMETGAVKKFLWRHHRKREAAGTTSGGPCP